MQPAASHIRAVPFPFPAESKGGIRLVNVPVYHDSGTVAVQQGTEALKAAVRQVLLISETADRSMREKNVKTSRGTDAPAQSSDPASHFLFCVHMSRVRTVAKTAAQTEDAHATNLYQLAVGA